MASGQGSTFLALLKATQGQGLTLDLPLQVVGLVADRNCGAIKIAEEYGIATHLCSPKTEDSFDAWDKKITQIALEKKPDFVLLLGFLRKIGPHLLKNFDGRILNTHPSLLPKFGGPGMYGRRVHEAVLKNNEVLTGISIHTVSAEYDSGPILGQKEVPVFPEDTPETLEERVKSEEKRYLIEFLYNWVQSV